MRGAIAGRLALAVAAASIATAAAAVPSDEAIERIVADEVAKVATPGGTGAAAVVRIGGRTLFFNFGLAERASKTPVTSDSLFNLASVSKVFDTALLAQAAVRGDLALDEPIGRAIKELRPGSAIGKVTFGQLASFTSGFDLPQDHPPWPHAHYTWPKFVRMLNAWKPGKDHRRGEDYIYSHAGIMLLHVALERRFAMPYAALLETRLLRPLGFDATLLPLRGKNDVAHLPPHLMRRAVQGYTGDGKPHGKRGTMGSYYDWPGTGQMFSTARDMAQFLALQIDPPEEWRAAVALAHRRVTDIAPGKGQAMAWEIQEVNPTLIDKNGGLHNGTTYIGTVAGRRLGLVLLFNRGNLNGRDVGQPILRRLAAED